MIIYFIKATLCTLFFFFIYVVLFEKENMHIFKRKYLMISLALSFILPVLPLPFDFLPSLFDGRIVSLYAENDIMQGLSTQTGIGNSVDGGVSAGGKALDYRVIIKLLYAIVMLILFIQLFISMFRLLFYTKTKPVIVFPDKRIVLIKEKLVPFSFGKHIYLNEEEYENGLIAKEMIMHEQAHVSQRHSFDIMFIELLIAIFWLNPVLLLYRRAIKQNHEYLADDAVIKADNNITRYQNILISIINKAGSTGLTSSLNYSTIKKRFIMMKKETSQRKAQCRKLLLVPVLLFAVCMFSVHTGAIEPKPSSDTLNDFPENPKQTDKISNANIDSSNQSFPVPEEAQANPDDSVYLEVDKMPEFPGGDIELLRHIATNAKYPKKAEEEGVYGIVKCSFIVEKDGSISNAKVDSPLHPELDNESLRVISSLPKFKPGTQNGKAVRVYYKIPVRYKHNK